MKLATWNVNSLNVRLPRLLAWLAASRPDVVCLQETKLEDAKFPRRELEDAGYASQVFGQRTYNGVAILTRGELVVSDVSTGLHGFDDEQKRVIAASVDGVRVVCAYVPNGQSVDSDKYQYKLRWCDAAARYLHDELAKHRELAFCGDLNIAPEPRDEVLVLGHLRVEELEGDLATGGELDAAIYGAEPALADLRLDLEAIIKNRVDVEVVGLARLHHRLRPRLLRLRSRRLCLCLWRSRSGSTGLEPVPADAAESSIRLERRGARRTVHLGEFSQNYPATARRIRNKRRP